MLLPVLLTLATSDASVRAGVNESFVQSMSTVGSSSLMHGVSASVHGETTRSSSAYSLDLAGLYGRTFQLTLDGDSSSSPNTYSTSLGTHGTFQLGPTTQLALDGAGFLATRLGVRSSDLLAARDPFLGDRLEYATEARASLSGALSRRASYRVSGTYAGGGGLASEDPEAVGADFHSARAGLSTPYELTARTFCTPELQYEYTHFYHALLDRWLTRGVSDIHSGTGLLGLSHVLTRRLMASAGGGVTVANPPPILASRALVVAPEARAQAVYLSRTSRATLSYEYSYTSLGPRIGYGQRHAALVEFGVLPASGRRWRELELRWLASFSHGSAPVVASLLSLPTGGTVPSQEGTLTSLTALAGVRLDVPIVRGVLLTSGYDIQFVRASFDPPSPTAGTSSQLVSVATLGIAAVLSTNRDTMVHRSLLVDGAADERGGEIDVDQATQPRPATGEEPPAGSEPTSETR